MNNLLSTSALAGLTGVATIVPACTAPRLPELIEEDLNKAAFDRLILNLEKFGNRLADDHKAALMCIVGRFTHLATGAYRGRVAFDLPCGGGKSQAIVAWC